MNEFSALRVHCALVFEVFGQFVWVHAIGALVDIDEVWACSGLANRFGCSDKGVRNSDNYVLRFYSGRSQSESNSVRSASHAHTLRCVAEARKLPLELLYFRATDKTGRAQGIL